VAGAALQFALSITRRVGRYGQRPGRNNEREITLFKSVGVALEDIATAAFVYQQALAEAWAKNSISSGTRR
jgi:hypothetical protein